VTEAEQAARLAAIERANAADMHALLKGWQKRDEDLARERRRLDVLVFSIVLVAILIIACRVML
jgi:hypothetical protein